MQTFNRASLIMQILMGHPYHSATAVVVQVHQGPGIFHHSLPGIYKDFGELDTIIHVVATATPVKVTHFIVCPSSFVGVTAAALELPLATSSSDCIHHTSRGDCIHKRCLTATCQNQNTAISLLAIAYQKKSTEILSNTSKFILLSA